MLSFREIVEKLGIPVQYISKNELLERYKSYEYSLLLNNDDIEGIIGDPPDPTIVSLWNLDGKIQIFCADIHPKDHNSIANLLIHEACHAVMGLQSIDDEGMLMAFEWQIMKFLNKEDYKHARNTFSINQYLTDPADPFSIKEVSKDNDDFQYTTGWLHEEKLCVEAGFLNSDLTPIWGLGIHSSYFD